jgi:hypothetical protein
MSRHEGCMGPLYSVRVHRFRISARSLCEWDSPNQARPILEAAAAATRFVEESTSSKSFTGIFGPQRRREIRRTLAAESGQPSRNVSRGPTTPVVIALGGPSNWLGFLSEPRQFEMNIVVVARLHTRHYRSPNRTTRFDIRRIKIHKRSHQGGGNPPRIAFV